MPDTFDTNTPSAHVKETVQLTLAIQVFCLGMASRMPCPSRESLFNEYSSELSQLRTGLPERFRPTLDYLIKMLPSLLTANWPLVPNHTDLLENNIHVSRETGLLAGICDWKDTVIGPFGLSLGGLQTMLGKNTLLLLALTF